MFHKRIKKIIIVEGMSCKHCSQKVENTLKMNPVVHSVKVNLEKQQVLVTLEKEVSDDVFVTAIENLGYKVISIDSN